MNRINKHLISSNLSVREVLTRLEKLAADAILFLVDKEHKLLGALTDGDIRRGLINGLGLDDPITNYVQGDPKSFKKGKFSFAEMLEWRGQNYKIIPVVNELENIVDIINFRTQRSYLPIDAVIMAGGKGNRLRPLTLDTPKPLLKIDDKPIIEYNVERIHAFGIRQLTISIKYLGEQLVSYFGDNYKDTLNVKYVTEDEPLGTIGAVAQIDHFENDYILVMNSDILTNIDFEELFEALIEKGGDMIVATTPYEVQIPYGVIETEDEKIKALVEKPTYTYYSNAGIYLFKKAYVDLIPRDTKFNATDLMDSLIQNGKKVLHFPIHGYWLDIGKPHDYEKAQRDIQHIKF